MSTALRPARFVYKLQFTTTVSVEANDYGEAEEAATERFMMDVSRGIATTEIDLIDKYPNEVED